MKTAGAIPCNRARWSRSRNMQSFAATRTGDRAYYYWLYPNFMINIYEGVMDTNLVLPLTTDRCLVQFDFFFKDVSEWRARARIRKALR